MYSRPSRIEINLDKLENNINTIKSKYSDTTEIIAVVKSNAYGMGDMETVRFLRDIGIKYFAVATTSEGLRLRREFDDINILVLGYTPEYLLETTIRNRIVPTIYEIEIANKINEMAKKLEVIAEVQIKIDTGMNRLGFKPSEQSLEEIKMISEFDNIKIQGIFSHFANSEDNINMTEKQFESFVNFVNKLNEQNVDVGIKHISNTGAVFNHPKFGLDAIRPGIGMYGTHDGDRKKPLEYGVEFIAELKTEIALVKTIHAGEGVSYGSKFVAAKDTKIATLPIGYADGIIRSMSGKIEVLINGTRCAQVGAICMDQLMVDVTDVDCKIGDEVVLIGEQGEEKIWIDEYSSAAGENNTPYLTHLSPRLCRVYLKNYKIVKTIDEILS